MYITNHENSRFRTKYPFVFVLAARKYYIMDIVLSKNGVKCAVFQISDVQMSFISWKFDYKEYRDEIFDPKKENIQSKIYEVILSWLADSF